MEKYNAKHISGRKMDESSLMESVRKIKNNITSGISTVCKGIFSNEATEMSNEPTRTPVHFADNLSNAFQSTKDFQSSRVGVKKESINTYTSFFADHIKQLSSHFKGIYRLDPGKLEDGEDVLNNQELFKSSSCDYQPPNLKDTLRNEITVNRQEKASLFQTCEKDGNVTDDDRLSEISNVSYKTALSEIHDIEMFRDDSFARYKTIEHKEPNDNDCEVDLFKLIRGRSSWDSIYPPQETASNWFLNSKDTIVRPWISGPENIYGNHQQINDGRNIPNNPLAINLENSRSKDVNGPNSYNETFRNINFPNTEDIYTRDVSSNFLLNPQPAIVTPWTSQGDIYRNRLYASGDLNICNKRLTTDHAISTYENGERYHNETFGNRLPLKRTSSTGFEMPPGTYYKEDNRRNTDVMESSSIRTFSNLYNVTEGDTFPLRHNSGQIACASFSHENQLSYSNKLQNKETQTEFIIPSLKAGIRGYYMKFPAESTANIKEHEIIETDSGNLPKTNDEITFRHFADKDEHNMTHGANNTDLSTNNNIARNPQSLETNTFLIKQEQNEDTVLESAPKRQKVDVAKRSASLEPTTPLILLRPVRTRSGMSKMNIKTLKSESTTSNELEQQKLLSSSKSVLTLPQNCSSPQDGSEIKTEDTIQNPVTSSTSKTVKNNVRRVFEVLDPKYQTKASLNSVDEIGDGDMSKCSTFHEGLQVTPLIESGSSTSFEERFTLGTSTGPISNDMALAADCSTQNKESESEKHPNMMSETNIEVTEDPKIEEDVKVHGDPNMEVDGPQ